MLASYQKTLQRLYRHYRTTVFDDDTGLVRTDIHLSGAKDITRRRSSFYDNVVFWKTTGLAMELELIPRDQAFLRQLKQRILGRFWLEEAGHFLEDLSRESLGGAYYSSDWLIALATGFLHPGNARERAYFERSAAYIREHKLAEPLPIKYQADTRAARQFFAVRLAVASYGGDAIWSFWGMEYIKTLSLLYRHTGERRYLTEANRHIKNYEQSMVRHGGFPEVYNPDGGLLQTPLYRSIRMTGWAIGFEQVKAMQRAATE